MKTIALVDHYEGGHHFAFIKLFAKYLLRLGYKVCIYFPGNENEILQYLKEEGAELAHVKFFKINLTKKKVKYFGRFNPIISTMHLWLKTRNVLNKSEKDFGIKIDTVFFAWADDYLVNDLPHHAVDLIFPYQWSGLFFHPWYLYEDNVSDRISLTSRDSVLRSKNCISIAIHDEFVKEKLEKRIRKLVVFFPEIADSTPPDTHYDLVKQLNLQAQGRTIVSLIGISKRKGFLFLIKLISVADPKEYFFFFSGDISAHDFNAEEETLVRDFLFKNLPSNCFYYPTSLEEGAKINAVISASDILFLVYHNFRSSSNFSTKAALFNKPVLAGNRYWIGRVTQKYCMGVTVNEGNIEEITNALDRLNNQIKNNTIDYSGCFDYLKVHHEENLEQAFKNALDI